ncbi:MAG TPA: SpoIIE family protein phosphatase [Nocardioidaceae bacterium]|nr:SpoIIE family protein phosphatase [Nocardioidaceae bacterium]
MTLAPWEGGTASGEVIPDDLLVFATLTEAINSNLDLERVLQTVTDAGTELSGADFGAFFYNAVDESGNLYRFHVLSGGNAAAFATMPAPRITELFQPTFSGERALRVADVTEDPRFTGMPRGHLPVRSYLATPVTSRSGEVIGALLFGHADPGMFSQRSEHVVRLVALQAAVAVENARLFEDEQAARREAEQAAARLGVLQAMTARLAGAVSTRDALDVVTDTLVGPLDADGAAVYLTTEDGYSVLAGVRTDENGDPAALQTPIVPHGAACPLAEAATSRRTVAISDPQQLASVCPEVSAAVTGVEPSLFIPMTFGDVVVGVLAMSWRRPRRFSGAELHMFETAAGQLASALERARLYESELAAQAQLRCSAEQAVAASQTLQRSLLPRTLPEVESLTVVVRYLPGTAGAEVGGDWYDVIATPGGGTVLVVGDVQGHSVGAAAVMGQLRTALHAYLAEGHEPHVALARVNRAMNALDARVLATCCLVALDPASGEASVVRAGHLLPLLRRDGAVREIGSDGGLPLGVLDDAEWPTTTVRLEAGDRLLMYTDGLVEDPREDVDTGISALMRATASTDSGDVDRDADAILAAVGVDRRDDIALLVCDYSGPSLVTQCATLRVTDVAEVSTARVFVGQTLAAWELASLAETVALVVSELVTNALVHTAGPATLEIRRQQDRIRVLVTDEHARVPRPQHAGEDATGGRGMLLVEALAEQWGVEPSGTGKTVWAELHAA